MPKQAPDRDDGRGNLARQGGPQDGPIGGSGDADRGGQGEGGPRHAGGSSRDSGQLGGER